jgi:hypothetical protein
MSMGDQIKMAPTQRGFLHGNFVDLYGEQCSIQRSSLATDYAIWLGIDNPEPKIMARDAAAMGREDLLNSGPERFNGWVKFPIPEQVQFTTRMHLNREQVAALLPMLQYFVEHGELPKDEADDGK